MLEMFADEQDCFSKVYWKFIFDAVYFCGSDASVKTTKLKKPGNISRVTVLYREV